MGIGEVALSLGELYAVLINKEAHGKQGRIIAITEGTDEQTVSEILLTLSRRRRFQVRKITLDMAPNMPKIAEVCFPTAKQVVDRFHVQKLVYDAVQEMRIKERWKAIDMETIEIIHAKACAKSYQAPLFENGDTRIQLLARSRYLLFKKESVWIPSQNQRVQIRFREYTPLRNHII